MAISFAEPLEIQCPECGTSFVTETWIVVDGNERPDLVGRILDTTLHDAQCPSCGQIGQVPAPLLYHDGRAQRVLLAVPVDMPDDELREAGQTLLWTLIGALPEAQRSSYLGELQAEAGLSGIGTIIRAETLAGGGPPPKQDEAEVPPLVKAIQALLSAHGPAELQRAMQSHPMLLEPQTITVLRELAHEAYKQGEDEAGQGFSGAAAILDDLRSSPHEPALHAPAAQSAGSAPPPDEDPLDELAFALLRSHTGETLAAVVDEYPELLVPTTDAALAAWADRARTGGKPRIADGIDERREALRIMRARFESERPVFDAVQALLDADTSEELEAVLMAEDSLYTDAADAILARLSTSGDAEVDAFIGERRALVQRVRWSLGQQGHDPSSA